MRKTELLAFLQNQTDFFDPDNLSEVFTASWLARRFAMQRNTASHYLNQLVAQDVLVKINTRPVYFLHKKAFCQQFYPLSRSEYASMAELLAESDRQPEQADHFSLLTGHDGSLRKPIEQMKTALFYPNGGLPLLITGDSGTGKSYMAELMHEFAIAQGLLAPDAPFVSFNCAQYASNPELLAANLFGYVKGAFTGAQSDKAGAFEAANGGMLFLDEVHRLDAQGQEKLFTWLDRKEIYRVGETAQGLPISLRLVFATTEDIHSTFLTTVFLAGGAHACRPAATNAATVAGPDAVCLSGQRRRAEECGEVRRGVSVGQVSGPRNVDRDAARSAGKYHGRDASAQRSDGPAGAAADRAADQPGLAAACARPGTGADL